MSMHALLFASALLSASFSAVPAANGDASVFAPEGGPPRVQLAGKASGDITKAEWSSAKVIGLHGCVPDARITALSICIKDCTNKAAFANGTDATITSTMRSMIVDLPVGTPFTVKVTVKDAKGKVWEVPDARYVWKG